MKRIVISAVLLAVCVAISVYTARYVVRVNEFIVTTANNALDAIAGEDKPELAARVDELCDYWDKEEDRLAHFIRHGQIDDITKSIARLRALADGGAYTELSAELESIRWQMEHVTRNEKLVLQNLL